jgi:23S rRNA (cytosine1962-C5)-methyltransferase
VSIATKLFTQPWEEYELLDAGGGKKLERFSSVTTIRPELQAYFKSDITFVEWEKKADCAFIEKSTTKGLWKRRNTLQNDTWNITYKDLQFKLELTSFKHVGIFPEQVVNWDFLSSNLDASKTFLNLFAYTGIASVVARNTGASVTHVDSIKQLIHWAKENMELNHLSDIRWIHEDALTFAQKEVKRGKKYDVILMDPPAFGFGAKGEKWILEQKLPALLETAYQLLSDNGTLILNTYSPKITLQDVVRETAKFFDKRNIEANELWGKTKLGKELFYGNLVRVKKGL